MLGLNLDIYKTEIQDIDNHEFYDKKIDKVRKFTHEDVQNYIREHSNNTDTCMVFYDPHTKKRDLIVVRNVHYSSKLRTIINRNIT